MLTIHTLIYGAGRVNAFLVMQELEKAGISGLSENIVNIRAVNRFQTIIDILKKMLHTSR